MPNITHKYQTLIIHFIALVIIVITAANLSDNLEVQTPTADEHLHLTRGLKWLKDRDPHLCYGHPPFANVLQALPSAFSQDSIDLHSVTPKRKGKIPHLAGPLFEKYPEKMRSAIVKGRHISAAFFIFFLTLLYFIIRYFWTPKTAILALILLSSYPNILAHAQFSTTDSIFVCVLLLLVFSLAWTLSQRSVLSLLPTGILIGVTLATKHSAPLYIVILFLIVALSAFLGLFRYNGLLKKKRITFFIRDSSVILILSTFTLFSAYHFQKPASMGTLRAAVETQDFHPTFSAKDDLNNHIFKELPDALIIPLPYTYIYGIANVIRHAEKGHSSYYMGKTGNGGWPSYYIVDILLKTPLSYFLLLFLTLVFYFKRKKRQNIKENLQKKYAFWQETYDNKDTAQKYFKDIALIVWLSFSTISFISASISKMNNGGLRYILPSVYMFILILTLFTTHVFFQDPKESKAILSSKKQIWVLTLIFSLGLIKTVSINDYLGDFNMAIGRERGMFIMMDLDWGQDASYLAKWRQKSIKQHDAFSKLPLYYQPYSRGDALEMRHFKVKVKHFGCRKTPKHESLLAIHRTISFRTNQKKCYPWLKKSTLKKVIHNHIEIYHFTPQKN